MPQALAEERWKRHRVLGPTRPLWLGLIEGRGYTTLYDVILYIVGFLRMLG